MLSGGPAPDSFKGFASAIGPNPPACGDSWTSRPGNSSNPPDTIPPYIGVVVSSSITQSGSPSQAMCPTSLLSGRTQATAKIRAILARAQWWQCIVLTHRVSKHGGLARLHTLGLHRRAIWWGAILLAKDDS